MIENKTPVVPVTTGSLFPWHTGYSDSYMTILILNIWQSFYFKSSGGRREG